MVPVQGKLSGALECQVTGGRQELFSEKPTRIEKNCGLSLKMRQTKRLHAASVSARLADNTNKTPS